jgi:antitoxin (DNA-binding transcriptional repressor) of toxin-antitoxin stability system
MKTVTIGFLRYNMGKMFHEIRERGQSYLLTHGGKPVARLLPVDDEITINADGSFNGGIPLTYKNDL